MKSVIEFFDISVVLPIEIFFDNKGYIFLEENPIVKRTKHVDTKYHFIHEYVKDGTFLIMFVKSEENMGGVFTKNPSVKSYEELSHEYVTRIENTKRERMLEIRFLHVFLDSISSLQPELKV